MDEFTGPFVTVFKISFKQSRFHTALKTSKIYSKFKSENPMDDNNYRPISLISTLSKFCEKIMFKRVQHCAQHNLFKIC